MRVWRLTCMCGFRLAGGNHGPMDAFLPPALSVLRAAIPLSFVLILPRAVETAGALLCHLCTVVRRNRV